MYGGVGTDMLADGSGNDGFYLGPDGRWRANDVVHVGCGAYDQIALDGNYTITVDERMCVEVLALLSRPTNSPNTYSLTIADGWLSEGHTQDLHHSD